MTSWVCVFVAILVLHIKAETIVYSASTAESIDWRTLPEDTSEVSHTWRLHKDGSSQLIAHPRQLLSDDDSGVVEGFNPDLQGFQFRKLTQAAGLSSGTIIDQNIIGNDDRIRVEQTMVFPWSAIGLLTFRTASGSSGKCTATLISEEHLVTAAHCIWDIYFQRWNSDFKFYPGRNGNLR
eukprot:TRINITY_DN7572_c0_g1_i1.p1 TRINITY_DN7572_c0_g1~~TRINITY_DN7572_c0_g1_i1.p1  ORF type:complete len:202 (+),score=2.81 TRINITY_DN7572_c0_g1_i1:68-607(+)